jgi:uncharacterized protein (DUF2336 family)
VVTALAEAGADVDARFTACFTPDSGPPPSAEEITNALAAHGADAAHAAGNGTESPVLCGLAANPALPSGLLDRLIAVADAALGAELASREDLSREQAAALASLGTEVAVPLAYQGHLAAEDVDPVQQPDAALALLDAGAGRAEWARLLAADPDAARREKLAACPGLPPDVVRTLSVDPEPAVVAELALWAPAQTAVRLARHPHAEVRRAVAANELTPPAALAALVTGEGLPAARFCPVCDREETPLVHDPQCPRRGCDLPAGASCDGGHESTVHAMYEQALRNPATPAEAVRGFAGHPSPLLRWTLAARSDLPPEVCVRLAADPVPGVRATLAENPVIGEDVMRRLAADRGHDVQRRLAHNPRVPLDVLAGLAGATRIGTTLLPRIAAASAAEAEELAASPDPVLRTLVATRRDLPAAIRDALAADADAKVLKAIAPHPGLSEAQLRSMADRHGSRVLAKVAANPDASAALLAHLTDLVRRTPGVRKAYREIARHPNATAPALLGCLTDPQARPYAARHPALPPETTVELLADDDWQVAHGAAANPSLPVEALPDWLSGARPRAYGVTRGNAVMRS